MKLTREISEAIKEVRHKRKINQTEFGNLVGVKQSQVARWENMEGKYIRDENWEPLKEIIKDYVQIDEGATYIPEFLPLPVVTQSGESFTNYKRKPTDKLYAYVSSDMEPTVPEGSIVLLDMFTEPIELPKEYVPMVEMRINLPHGSLVFIKWNDSEEYQIRRVLYKSEGNWYGMYLSKANGFDKDAIKLTKADDIQFFGFVKAIVKRKAISSGFID